MLEENRIKTRFLLELEKSEKRMRVVKEELPELKKQLRASFKEAQDALKEFDARGQLKYLSHTEAEKLLIQIAEEEIQKIGQEYGLEFSKGELARILF